MPMTEYNFSDNLMLARYSFNAIRLLLLHADKYREKRGYEIAVCRCLLGIVHKNLPVQKFCSWLERCNFGEYSCEASG